VDRKNRKRTGARFLFFFFSYVTGWILTFFPYVVQGGQSMINYSLEWKKAMGLTLDVFPPALSKAPFRWKYYDQAFDMHFIGGIVGVVQNEEMEILPKLSWVIVEEEEKEDEPQS